MVGWLQALHSVWDNSIPKDQASVTLLQGNCANETRDFVREVDGSGGLVTKSCLTLAPLWTVACQAPLSMGFSRQEHWSGLPFPSLGIPGTYVSCLAGGFFTIEPLGKSSIVDCTVNEDKDH